MTRYLLPVFLMLIPLYNVAHAGVKINIPGTAVSASTYNVSCACVPANTVDGNSATRWSGYGDGAHITFDLGAPHTVEQVKIAWLKGNERIALFDVLAADTHTGPWTYVLTGKTSSGTTAGLEQYDFPGINARYIRIVGHGSSAGAWNSILETQVFGTTIALTPPESKINIPGTAVSASTYDTRCACMPANTVDGNSTTRWSGYGDGAHITFDLGAPHTVEQVKIAWHKGNERMILFDVQAADTHTGPWTYVLTGKTSSGTTAGLEQYDFPDINARYIRIVGHGSSAGAWNSILETQVFGTTSTPLFNPPSGTYLNKATVSITSAMSGLAFRYTMNGSTPTPTNGFVYSAPVPITATTTLKAIAIKNGIADSAVTSATYNVTSGGGSSLTPSTPPSGNFDLTKWKLTIPNGSDISVATLNSGYTLTNAFYTDPVTGGMVFRTPNIAGTTSNSSYSRSELREMLNERAGTQQLGNNWVLGTSSATAKAAAGGVDGSMKVALSVDHVSTTGDSAKVGRVVVGQIHGPDTEIIRLYYHKRPTDSKGAIYFGHDTPLNSNSYHAIIGNPAALNPVDGIALGERWSYEIKVVGQTLIVSVTPEGRPTVTKTLAIESGYNDLYLYYKVGVYNQNNTGDATDYVQATVYSLTNTHP